MNTTTYLTWGMAVALALTAPAAAQKGRIKDTIVLSDGSRVRGAEVTAMTVSELTYRRGSKEHKILAGKVEEVQWHEPPEAYLLAQAAEAKGDYEDAANLYLEAAKGTKRAPFAAELQFAAARALLAAAEGDPAQAEGAAAALQRYIDEHPQGFRIPQAKLGLVRALRLMGKPEEAVAKVTALEEEAVRGNWGVLWEAKAKLEKAKALVATRKFDDARSAYRRVTDAIAAIRAKGSRDPSLTSLEVAALVGEGETYVAEGKYDQALSYFQRHVTEPHVGEPSALAAAALAGAGEARFLMATADGKVSDPDVRTLREAQMDLAKANVLDTQNGETTAKALYFSGKAVLALGGERERNFRARALAYFDSVVRFHSTSSWAARARAELAK